MTDMFKNGLKWGAVALSAIGAGIQTVNDQKEKARINRIEEELNELKNNKSEES